MAAHVNKYFSLSETNQELIMSEGGIALLSKTADDAEDPQTLRMVAGAIANLCGNGTQVLFIQHACFIKVQPSEEARDALVFRQASVKAKG